MKFDCIIMNPPYKRNLHLQILAKVIEYLKDENSKCINLSPIKWLQDPISKFKKNTNYIKFEESISKKLDDIEIIDLINSQKLFNYDIVLPSDLGIYTVIKNNGKFDYTSLQNKIVIKIFKKIQSFPKFDINKQEGIRVRFPVFFGNSGSGARITKLNNFGKMLYFIDGKTINGKPWHTQYRKNQYYKYSDYIPYSIKFNSEEEAFNFCNMYTTKFCIFYTHFIKISSNIGPNLILWVGDCINPRTGKIGYKSEWTDEDFYKYFNITKEEQKIIEETIAKYSK